MLSDLHPFGGKKQRFFDFLVRSMVDDPGEMIAKIKEISRGRK